ncbi:MAG: hypothetical protein HY360_04345 [Verrucomicrobia bacterium]|nr:hypothetical protein [Verrucomicrobiota bacterium]
MKIEFCRDGLFRNITLNGNLDTPIRRTEGAFFAVRAEKEGCVLGRVIAGKRMHGLAPVEKLDFEGVYPCAVLRAEDRYFPLRVEIHATGTVLQETHRMKTTKFSHPP